MITSCAPFNILGYTAVNPCFNTLIGGSELIDFKNIVGGMNKWF